MDIPAPKDINEQKPAEGTEVPTQDKQEKDVKKDEKLVDDAQSKIAELLSSKKYTLSIKEKRTKPLLDFSLGIKKHKKSIKKKQKSKKEKEPVSKKKQMIEIAVVAVLLLGLFFAIDTGLVDIGWKPPFTIFGKKQNEQILNFTSEAANEK